MTNIDVPFKRRRFTAFGGEVFTIAPRATGNITIHGSAIDESKGNFVQTDDLTGARKEDKKVSGFVYVDISKVYLVRVGERWSVTENIDQVDGTDRGIFDAPFPDGRSDYSQAVFGNSSSHAQSGSDPVDDKTALCSAMTAAAVWSNTRPNATALFTSLKRVL